MTLEDSSDIRWQAVEQWDSDKEQWEQQQEEAGKLEDMPRHGAVEVVEEHARLSSSPS